jgi:hypothetical protein
MTRTRLYAFTDSAGPWAFTQSVPSETFRGMQFVSQGAVNALIGPEPTPWPWQDRNQFTAMRLVHYHRVLGEAVKHFPVIIPASFESVFNRPEAIPPAIAQYEADILPLMKDYGALRQFSLSVKWDITAMQKLMQSYPAALASSSLEKERRLVRDQFLVHLQGHLRDLIILNDGGGETVFQAMLLVEAQSEETITTILQALDEECQGRLHIKLLGPMPASNFARVELKQPDAALIKQARQDLGLASTPAQRLSEVKEAYRRKVRNLQPEGMAGDNHELMTRITRSYRYLSSVAARQNLREKNDPDKQWLRYDQKTLRRTPLLNIQRGISRWDDAVIKRN